MSPLCYAISLFLLLVSLQGSVIAAIYPTRPIASTVYTAGQPAVINWENDASSGQMGPFKVELCTASDTLITTLATNVKPAMGTYTLFLSLDLLYIGNDYVMRMVSSHPKKTVYTANFKIQGVAQSPSYPDSSIPSPTSAEPAQLALRASSSTISSSPSSSSPSNTLTPAPSSSFTPGYASSSLTVVAPPLNDASGGHANTASSRRLDLNMNRFVVILWPAVVGVMMAL